MNRPTFALLASALLTLSLLAGGCKTQEEFDDVVAMNNRLMQQRDQCLSDLERVRSERERLQDELAALEAQLQGKDRELALQGQANDQLRAEYDALFQRYQDALNEQVPVPPVGPVVALPPELDAQLQQWARQYPEMVEYDRQRGMVKFKTDLLFGPGSAEVNAEATETLNRLATIINSASAADFQIYVCGHTDDIPISRPQTLEAHPTNWHLSTHRAIGVVRSLFEAGVPQRRMGAMGFSKYHPVAPNAEGNRGNPLNRRVEIWIVPPSRYLTTDDGAAVDETGDQEPPK